jgi:nitrogen fixation protein NifU and related proteins
MTSAVYSAAVRERCREPRRAGAWPDGEPGVGTGSAGSLDAGVWTRLQVRVGTDGRIDDTRFKVFGCSAAIASASFAADALIGATLAEARALAPAGIVDALGLQGDKRAMAALATEAARGAVDDWERKTGTGDQGPGTGDSADGQALSGGTR